MRRLLVALLVLPGAALAAPLPSWNDGAAKQRIVAFVEAVTEEGGSDWVPPAERIAVFDNDGTLWAEQPLYFQFVFALDRVKALAPAHPEWRARDPFRAVLDDDLPGVLATGKKGLVEILMESHAGTTTDEFAGVVREWLSTARHPRFDRPYPDLAYRPMLELLDHLRENGFEVWIVSGGGIEFLRVFSEETYGVPPQQVVGSSIGARYEVRDGKPVLVRLPEVSFVDDKAGKPVGIQHHIGRRPLAAFGNSDGDFEMLEWTTAGTGPRLGVLVHHTDAEREWAYDRDSHIGRLDRGLDEADARGWVVVDMKRDWSRVFAFED